MASIIPVPAFADNYIWTLRQDDRAVVVDPGDAAPVIAFLERERLTLTAVLATHHHGDHVGGIPALKSRWDVPVYGPAHESIPERTRALSEGDTVTLPDVGMTLSVLDIPGHTAGHIAFVGEDVVFCGDTLFAAGCGRLFEGTPAQMLASLDKLARLPAATRVYCGHEYTLANLRFASAVEPGSTALLEREKEARALRERSEPTLPSTIGVERQTNPFLRVRDPAVRAAAERHAGRKLGSDVAVFAEVRAWKNAF
jgi:hydroxyacylglutathione hydrolase